MTINTIDIIVAYAAFIGGCVAGRLCNKVMYIDKVKVRHLLSAMSAYGALAASIYRILPVFVWAFFVIGSGFAFFADNLHAKQDSPSGKSANKQSRGISNKKRKCDPAKK